MVLCMLNPAPLCLVRISQSQKSHVIMNRITSDLFKLICGLRAYTVCKSLLKEQRSLTKSTPLKKPNNQANWWNRGHLWDFPVLTFHYEAVSQRSSLVPEMYAQLCVVVGFRAGCLWGLVVFRCTSLSWIRTKL